MTDYEKADAAYKAAFAIFAPIRDGYRTMTISDEKFLAAKAVFDKATAEFDAAYLVAQDAA